LLTSVRGASKQNPKQKIPICQALASQGPRKRTNTQTHSESPFRGELNRIQIYVRREGGSGEKQGQREWWEGGRRERGNREKRGGREKCEDNMKERDEARRGGGWRVREKEVEERRGSEGVGCQTGEKRVREEDRQVGRREEEVEVERAGNMYEGRWS